MTLLDEAIYGGVNAAVLTPMTPDYAPDVALMAAHCRWLLANGCDGLGVLGTPARRTASRSPSGSR
jgi:4-hydroxy-tetrahydrodipicolinate synthase